MNTATCTANGKYEYGSIWFGKTLDEWIQNCHRYNSEKNLWKYTELKPGSFGYDNLAHSLCYAFQTIIDGEYGVNNLASAIHNGWSENYLFWRDHQPGSTNTLVKYYEPYNKLGDERRNMAATTRFQDLPKDEQVKDIVIASFLLENIQEKKPHTTSTHC